MVPGVSTRARIHFSFSVPDFSRPIPRRSDEATPRTLLRLTGFTLQLVTSLIEIASQKSLFWVNYYFAIVSDSQ